MDYKGEKLCNEEEKYIIEEFLLSLEYREFKGRITTQGQEEDWNKEEIM